MYSRCRKLHYNCLNVLFSLIWTKIIGLGYKPLSNKKRWSQSRVEFVFRFGLFEKLQEVTVGYWQNLKKIKCVAVELGEGKRPGVFHLLKQNPTHLTVFPKTVASELTVQFLYDVLFSEFEPAFSIVLEIGSSRH